LSELPRVAPPRSLARVAVAAGAGALIFAASYVYRDPAAVQGSQDLISLAATWLLTGR